MEVQCIADIFKTTLENQGTDLTEFQGEWQLLKSLTNKRSTITAFQLLFYLFSFLLLKCR